MSKALPVFRPHNTSAPVATYDFCMRSIVPVLSLRFESFASSLLVFVSQVSVSILLFSAIYRWPPKHLVHPTLSKPRELLAAATLLGNSVSYPLTSLLRVLLKSRVYQGRGHKGRSAGRTIGWR